MTDADPPVYVCPTPPPFRRRVFYIPGFDPNPPRRYRELYRREGADQATLSGYDLTLTARAPAGHYGWTVVTRMDGRDTRSEIEVLVWADIVQTSMGRGILTTYLQLMQTAWIYVASGALFRLMRLRKGPVIVALYPVAALLLQLAVAVIAGWFVGRFLWGTRGASDLGWPGLILAAAVGAGASGLILRGFRRLDRRIFAYYLMHDYAFTARDGGAYPAALRTRMAQFGKVVAQALQQDVDEVLVVGHSSGVHLGVSVLADLIRSGLPERRPALAFLSLGQVVPMMSFLPRAHQLRRDLAYLGSSGALTWVDVTAPGDGCAFALCDPVAVSGVAGTDKRWPLVLSAAFSQTLTPDRWRAVRWRFFRLHFQYLCAFDNLPGRVDDYDYFRITAGPKTLAARFANRGPSKSRIERAVNPFTDLAA